MVKNIYKRLDDLQEKSEAVSVPKLYKAFSNRETNQFRIVELMFQLPNIPNVYLARDPKTHKVIQIHFDMLEAINEIPKESNATQL